MQVTESLDTARRSSRARIVRLAAIALCASLFAATGVACESAADNDPTPVQTFKITPAPADYATSAPAIASTATEVSAPAAASSSVTLVTKGSNLKFDKESITVAAGPVTITFDNQDSGIPHNINVFEGTDAKGTSVGKTDLETGPVTQELKLDLKPGTYFYHCDAHPTTMKGTLTVE